MNKQESKRVVYTVEELQAFLGISTRTAYELAKRIGKQLPGKRGRVLVPKENFARWLAEGGQP